MWLEPFTLNMQLEQIMLIGKCRIINKLILKAEKLTQINYIHILLHI